MKKEKEVWEDYTMLDFMKILSENSADAPTKDEYYKFVGTINRFNRLLERMYCEECEHILYPITQSTFAHYRVVRFHCENSECSKSNHSIKENEIYLHHCMNGKCNGIIDSRKSHKCANGLYICSNESCGCCCSNDMLKRRLENLKKVSDLSDPFIQTILADLEHKVKNQLGHLERAEHFCYKCGELMQEISEEKFRCESDNIEYDLTRNKFKRPLKNLSRTQRRQQPTQPPPNNNFNEDRDDLPF